MTADGSRPDPAPELTAYLDEFGAQYAAAVRDADAPPREGRERRSPRRFRLGVALGGVVAAAGLAVVLLPSGGKLDVVEAANAALGGEGEILHYTVRSGTVFQGIAPKSRCERPEREVWQATTGRPRYRVRIPGPPAGCADGEVRMPDGAIVTGDQEYSWDAGTQTYYVPDLDRLDVTTGVPDRGNTVPLPGMSDMTGDPIADIRAALEGGQLRAAGRVREGGRELLVLTGLTRETTGTGKPPSGTIVEHALRYLVDARTYTPVRLTTSDTTHFFKGNGRPRDGQFTSSYTSSFDVYEALPFTAANERLLSIHPVRPPATTVKTAAERAAENRALMKAENAEGRRNAARIRAEQARKAR